jgi:hypothetical protein
MMNEKCDKQVVKSITNGDTKSAKAAKKPDRDQKEGVSWPYLGNASIYCLQYDRNIINARL